MKLTKDADLLACCVYKEYLARRKQGVDKRRANTFKSDFRTSPEQISSWSASDYSYTVAELSRAGLVKMYFDGMFVITDDFVIYMENRFKNNLVEITDFISKFIP